MFYALWFLIKLAVLIAVLVWVTAQQGSVELAWMTQGDEYAVQTTLGVFGATAVIAAFLLLSLHKALLSVGFSFKSWRLKRRLRKQGKAQKFVMQSLSSIAAGDERMADKFAARARKMQQQDHGMTDFLDAVIARMRGDHGRAKHHFGALAQQKHSSFLGMRGLMQVELDEGQMHRAVLLAERAYKMNPKQPWMAKTLYKMYIQRHDWQKAEDILARIEKLKAVRPEKAQSDRIAILLARADAAQRQEDFDAAFGLRRRAYKMDKASLPAALALLDNYLTRNEKRKAVRLIETVWPHHPHPQLLAGWKALMPTSRQDDTGKYMGWFERLLALKPDCDEGQLAVAEAALHEKMYGQARAYLKAAERLRVSKKLYRLYARLEEAQNNDRRAAQQWLDRAIDAPENKAWVCTDTGLVYEAWQLFATPHNSFNTIIWDIPTKWKLAIAANERRQRFDPVLLAPSAEAA